jgi:hypothetical protein
MSGWIKCPGNPEDQSAYCSELAGIISIFLIVKKLYSFLYVHQSSVNIGCDGLSTLKLSFHSYLSLDMDFSHHDLISAIHKLKSQSPIAWTHT